MDLSEADVVNSESSLELLILSVTIVKREVAVLDRDHIIHHSFLLSGLDHFMIHIMDLIMDLHKDFMDLMVLLDLTVIMVHLASTNHIMVDIILDMDIKDITKMEKILILLLLLTGKNSSVAIMANGVKRELW